MKDSIINGTGNSRYLKSVENFRTLYPTYGDFAEALEAGTLPIDLNGINPDGFKQVGDSLGKANVLKDATAALYGKDDNTVPDEIFAFIAENYKRYKELQRYETAGAFTFIVPENIHHVLAFIISGGASGPAIATSFSGTYYYNGGNSGSLAVYAGEVTPEQEIPVVVGAGGEAVTATYDAGVKSGNAGGSSSFNGVVAVSGNGIESNIYDSSDPYNLQTVKLSSSTLLLQTFLNIALMQLFYPYGKELSNFAAGGGIKLTSNTINTVVPSQTFTNGKVSSAGKGANTSTTAVSGTDFGCGGGAAVTAAKSGTAKSAAGMNGVVAIWGL